MFVLVYYQMVLDLLLVFNSCRIFRCFSHNIKCASGGSDEETSDSIRFNVRPKQLAVQNRASGANDYKRIIERDYAQADSAIVYGGEQADPKNLEKYSLA